MRRRDLLSRSEERALELLERSLLGESYRVYVLVPLRKLIEADEDETLDEAQRRMLTFGEVDFLVVDRRAGVVPVFAVEFDGHPSHRTPEGAARDEVKDLLLARAGIPLLRIPDEALGEKEQITLLEWIVDCFRFRITHAAAIRQRLDYWGYQSQERLRETGRPYYFDEALAVHALNPFPATNAIKSRLKERFGLLPPLEFEGVDRPYTADERVLQREALASHAAKLREYVAAPLVIHDPNQARDELDEDGKQEPAEPPDEYVLFVVRPTKTCGPEIVYRAAVPIRWSSQHRASQAVAAMRTGTWVWAVDVALAEYLALAEIERWADRTLVRLDR